MRRRAAAGRSCSGGYGRPRSSSGRTPPPAEQRLMPPPGLYQRSKELEAYFDGNPDAWFAADRYGPWLVQLRGMGVRQAVEVRARTPNQAGYVIITVEFGRNERGLDGFDPGGGDRRPGFRAGAIPATPVRSTSGTSCSPRTAGWWPGWWNGRCWPPSVTPAWRTSGRRSRRPREREAWLPGPDGTFRRPAELSLDDLPPTYTRDEGLAQALNMLPAGDSRGRPAARRPAGGAVGAERPPGPGGDDRARAGDRDGGRTGDPDGR